MSSLLPNNSTELERRLADIAALTHINPEPIRTLWNPATCPVALLPWLAWALSVDEWDDSWTEAQRRAVIAASVEVHRHKGTVFAVKRALAATGLTPKLTEWWQQTPRGIPHTFSVDVEISDRGITPTMIDRIEAQIISVKPVRSHVTTRVIGKTSAALRLGCLALSGENTLVQPKLTTEIAITVPMRLAIGHQAHIETWVYPKRLLLAESHAHLSMGIGYQDHVSTTVFPERLA